MSDRDMSGYYTYVENKDKTWTGIGLTDKAGKWQGVVYEYGKVSIKEDEENDTASLEFEWNLLDSNGLGKEFFDNDFFTRDLKLKDDQVVGFLEHIDKKLPSQKLLKVDKKFELIDYLISESKSYKAQF